MTADGGPTYETSTHHALAVHEVVLLLETDLQRGLTISEADRRRREWGPNALPASGGHPWWRRLAAQFHNPLVYVLLASAAVTATLGQVAETAVILGVVLANAAVGFVQESRAEAALDALRAMVRTSARVVRDGVVTKVDSDDVVPGDLLVLEAGDRVPADARVISVAELRVDESMLTGESLPVGKEEVVLAAATPVADRRNILYSGTLVAAGSGTAIVVGTGAATEIGIIHRLVGGTTAVQTPLTRRLVWFSKLLTIIIVAMAALTFVVGISRGEPWPDMFTAAVALAVGAIPEGLPAAITVVLAIGVSRMAKRRAVIRRMPAVETLGSTTVICTDKTGTLTENRMSVTEWWSPASAAPDGAARQWSLRAAVLCNDAAALADDEGLSTIGDPTETALLNWAHDVGVDIRRWRVDHERLEALPFSSERQCMVTRHQPPDAGSPPFTVAKGSAERILRSCSVSMDADGELRPLDADAVHAEVERMAGQGLRVLATSVALDHGSSLDSIDGMAFTGLIAMQDAPRAEAVAAVAACHRAGVAVKMITGDHAATAASIADQVGIRSADAPDGTLLTGHDLEVMAPDEMPEAVARASVFARVTPQQKLALVAALQRRGEVVAMTGDGVNDAPALRLADIGVAMGRDGTEVAKEAADMVLTDDDFATIEAAVEEGRGVFDNLIKFIAWTLPTNMAEGLVILVAIATGTALPILPVQILWINMTTAVLLGLMLAFEAKEPGIMARPPRDPRRPLLTGALVARIVMVSVLMVGGAWWVFTWESDAGGSLDASRTAAVNLFVAVEIVYLFSCRSLRGPSWRLGWFSNPWILAGVMLQLLAQAAITYLPAMNAVFDTAPLDLETWLRIAAIAAATGVVVALDKRITGRRL